LALCLVLALLVARLGGAVDRRSRARTAADAAALACAADGDATAGDLARRNGAVLTSVSIDGASCTVSVQVGDERASARADRSW
jgi:hypothetical protein